MHDEMPNDFGGPNPIDLLTDTLRELTAWIFPPGRDDDDWRDDPSAVARYEGTGQ